MLKKIKVLCMATLMVITPTLTMAISGEVRKITPPKLDTAYLGQKILCYRPMRHGSPKMSVEEKDSKIIANNYGHGGSGWTLGPGSAEYVNNLLINSKYATDLTKDTPITIIGAGVLGLFTAYDLEQKGFKNITIVAEKFDGLASNNAGGLLAPVSMDNDQEIQTILQKIEIDAYKFYASIAKKQHPHFKEGAIIVPTYFRTREESGLEPYVGKVMKPAKDVTVDFDNGTTRKMIVYDDGIFMDTGILMAELNEYLRSKNIKFVQKKVNSFAELDGKFIFNCTGLGASKLNNDEKLVSVQGHLIMLKDQNPKDIQYMILTRWDEGKTKSGQKIERDFYIFPKHMPNTGVNDLGVIGGTFIEGATPATPNDEEFGIILQNAKEFYGIKQVP
ncbi:FAD-dependent oxidoreductase [Candidatus Tisiphia endosymbiont of Ptychoptera albimana]|uniref:FAD-dependent oxidoreductase n=1 Tax=Candidatus Tisiphia endosymbiont of Ptychoptera albimana TaxID=3066260 RepID=UPI00312C7FAC